MGGPKEEWKDLWVLLVDIMGFSVGIRDATYRDTLAALYVDVVRSVFEDAIQVEILRMDPQADLDAALRRWQSHIRIFSDSIVVFFEPSDDWSDAVSQVYLGHAAGNISRTLWRAGLPHRGAVAHGKCYINKDINVFLGEPIVDAYQWESRQKWLGISVAPDSIDAARQLLGPCWRSETVPTSDGLARTVVVQSFTTHLYDIAQLGVPDPVITGFLQSLERVRSDPRLVAKYRATFAVHEEELEGVLETSPVEAIKRLFEALDPTIPAKD